MTPVGSVEAPTVNVISMDFIGRNLGYVQNYVTEVDFEFTTR